MLSHQTTKVDIIIIIIIIMMMIFLLWKKCAQIIAGAIHIG
jgi:hypothetical protein